MQCYGKMKPVKLIFLHSCELMGMEFDVMFNNSSRTSRCHIRMKIS